MHSYYDDAAPSGENVVVDAQAEALRRAGHHVEVFGARTSDLSASPLYAVRAAARVATGRGRAPDGLAAFAPDVVHVHNLFPNFGRHWVRAVDGPLVATLHNLRPVCANGMLLRDGRLCTLCVDGDAWAGVRHACYRDSRLATLPQALANRGGPAADPVLARADRVIAVNARMVDYLARAGLPRERVDVVPNFVADAADPGPPEPDGFARRGWLFVGRLAREKGIVELLDRWPAGHALTVVGDGVQREAVAARATPDVRLVGAIARAEVLDLMRSSIGLVVPSTALEGSPLTYAEALASGLPVLAFAPNAVATAVREDGTGATVTWEADLAEALAAAEPAFAQLGAHCRTVFERRYGERAFVATILGVYAAAGA